VPPSFNYYDEAERRGEERRGEDWNQRASISTSDWVFFFFPGPDGRTLSLSLSLSLSL